MTGRLSFRAETDRAAAPRRSRALTAICCLVLALAAAPALAQQPPATSPEVAFWVSVRDSQDPAEIEAYLKAYPNGQFAPLARIRLNKLKPGAASGSAAPAQPAAPAAGAAPTAAAAPAAPPLSTIKPEPGKPARATASIKIGAAPNSSRGMLGVQVTTITGSELGRVLGFPTAEGALVTSVVPNGSAEVAGIQAMDFIVEIEGGPIVNHANLVNTVSGTPPGSTLSITLWRPAANLQALIDHLRGRAEAGDEAAAYGLAWIHVGANGVLKDDAQALRWSRQAAAKGHPGGSAILGHLRLFGLGTDKNEAEAARLFKQAAEKDNAYAVYQLANMYANGQGVAKNLQEAFRLRQKGAELGHGASMTALALMYLSGGGVAKDEAVAAVWFRRAADIGDSNAYANLGWLYESGRGVYQDLAEALTWYKKAAGFGQHGAMYRLGAMTEAGNGVPKDEVVAVDWYRKAANLGNTSAMVALGLMYQYGRGVTQDESEALMMFIKASEKGVSQGSFYAAHYYERHKDFKQAVTFYKKAAAKGDTAAMHNLAVAYEYGRGVGKDHEVAAEWVFKALKGGAAFSLKQMTENSGVYSEAFRRHLQRELKQAGVFKGKVNGNFGPDTKAAMAALAKRAKGGS